MTFRLKGGGNRWSSPGHQANENGSGIILTIPATRGAQSEKPIKQSKNGNWLLRRRDAKGKRCPTRTSKKKRGFSLACLRGLEVTDYCLEFGTTTSRTFFWVIWQELRESHPQSGWPARLGRGASANRGPGLGLGSSRYLCMAPLSLHTVNRSILSIRISQENWQKIPRGKTAATLPSRHQNIYDIKGDESPPKNIGQYGCWTSHEETGPS